MSHVVALNGAASDEVEEIDEQTFSHLGMERTAEESKALLQKIENVMAKNDLPKAELYFDVKRKLLRKEVLFHRGKWVNLKFTPDLRYWSDYGGRYKIKSSTSIWGFGSSSETQYLCYNTSFPPPYEVELTDRGR